MRLAAAAAAGGTAAVLGRRAWREPSRARLRAARVRSRWRLPVAVRRPLGRALHDAQLAVTPEDAVGMAITAVLVAGLLAAAFSVALAPVAALGVAVAGPVGLVLARGRGQRRFVAALPAFVELMSARLRSGHTVATALADAGARSDVVAPDVRGLLQRMELGEPLSGALAWWAEERRLDPVRAVAGSLAVATETGGAAADALEGLARSLRDQLGARAEAASLSAQARLSAFVVGLAPIAYVVFASAVDPHAASALVTSTTGRLCLVLGLALDALGALWMRRIARSEP
ncbi:MAG: type II secretion system F family protein [Acidimicrobiia bacterium]